MKSALDSNMTDTMMNVAQRLPALAEGTPPEEVITALMTMAVEEDAETRSAMACDQAGAARQGGD